MKKMFQFLFSRGVFLCIFLSNCIFFADQVQGGSKKPVLVDFILYCRDRPNGEYINVTTPTEKLLEYFTKPECIKCIVHGWMQNAFTPVIQDIMKAYLLKTECYVIVVNWNYEAKENYIAAIKFIRGVGELIADLLLRLRFLKRCFLNSLHLIGHSLGCHVVGYAARFVHEKTDYKAKIGRVTGLDCANPGFETLRISQPMGRGDATYFDAIHTCSGLLGMSKSIGDFDFRCNKGKHPQPGCKIMDVTCSHQKSCYYFKESIMEGEKAFKAHLCDSKKDFENGNCDYNPTAHMGEHLKLNDSVPGDYYLETKSDSPYTLS
ncbi:phospholipase A1 isoform X4 [Nilaparvata lugens]|uniref:phospholipase A1 isoform X4 n=1 Tax=Nilaparvata lugens TaxID=108931 RepID=UPI00193CF48C|nr:phospholipase A1 isoform X4 [Nilaparvata lugens]